MDIKMPLLGGNEVIKILQADKDLKSIPVILITASVMKEEEGRVMKTGCAGYLTKPLNRRDLYSLLSSFLPHTKGDSLSSKEEEIPVKITLEEKSQLPELLEILEDLKNEWNLIHKNFIFRSSTINKIKKFTGQVINLGEKYNLKVLVNWGEKLLKETENYNKNATKKILDNFPQLLTDIRKIMEGENE